MPMPLGYHLRTYNPSSMCFIFHEPLLVMEDKKTDHIMERVHISGQENKNGACFKTLTDA